MKHGMEQFGNGGDQENEPLPPKVRISKRFTPGHARFPRELMPDTAEINQLRGDYEQVAGQAYAEAEAGILSLSSNGNGANTFDGPLQNPNQEAN